MSEVIPNQAREKCVRCSLGVQTGVNSNCLTSRYEAADAKVSPLITLVIENPSREDDGAGQALTESAYNRNLTSGQAVWRVIKQLGIPPELVNIVPLTRCHLRGRGGKLTDENVRACLPYLWDELRRYRPKVVVAMGATVAKYLTSHKKLQNARGHYGHFKLLKSFDPVPEDLQDLVVTSTAAPGAVQYQMTQGIGGGHSNLVEDLTQVWYKITGVERDPRCDYAWLNSYEEIDAYLTEVEALYAAGQIPGCIMDVETNQQLDPFKKISQLVAIGFSHKKWFGRAIMINHKDQTLFQLPGVWEAVVRRLRLFFRRVPTGGWNYKFDLRWTRRHLSIDFFLRPYFDGLLAHNAIFSELAPHGLKDAAIQLLGAPIQEAEKDAAMQQLRHLYPENSERWHMGWIDQKVLLNYLCGDVDKTCQLYYYMEPMLDNDHCYRDAEFQRKYPGMSHRAAYNELMLDAVLPFSEIEDNGLAVNQPMLKWFEAEYPKRIERNLEPILATPWAQRVYKAMCDKIVGEILEKERQRVERRVMTEQQKAATKPGYVAKVITARTPEELLSKVEFKPPRAVVSYYIHLSKLLYEEAGVPAKQLGIEAKTRKGKGGALTTYYPTGVQFRSKILDWAVLNKRPDIEKLVRDVEKFKKDEKLYSGYVKRMPEFTEADGFLRTTYNLTGARTGRCSTTDPNLHAMPTKDFTDVLAITKLFVSRWLKEGGLILQLDYSQLEMRLVAAIAHEQRLIDIFLSGVDTHRMMAATIFRKDPKDITSAERKIGKTIAFGILYGMQARALAARTGLSLEEAEEKIATFFAQFPNLKKWMDRQVRDMRSRCVRKEGTGQKRLNNFNGQLELVDYQMDLHGYITTVFGRKRILKDSDHWVRSFRNKAERQAFNTPIQSAASDIALAATIRIHNRLKEEGLQSKVFGFIHDSIKTDVHPDEFLPVIKIMREEMELRPKEMYPWLTIPIQTSAEIGTGWGYHGEIKQYDLDQSTFEIEADATNLGLIERALSCKHNVETTASEEIKEKDVLVGYKNTYKVQPYTTLLHAA